MAEAQENRILDFRTFSPSTFLLVATAETNKRETHYIDFNDLSDSRRANT